MKKLTWPGLGFNEPQIMAILNVTPNSFSDGGVLYRSGVLIGTLVDRAAQALAAGASILDVGGESTRPGADSVQVEEELERVIPSIEALNARFDAVISVDTSTPEVMEAAQPAGAQLINDVRALTRPGALAAAVKTGLPVCLMHMQGTPQTMQAEPIYKNVVSDVLQWLLARADVCQTAGLGRDQILIDPGFGFGKTLEHNVLLFHSLSQFIQAGYPVMVGVSKKAMIGQIIGRPVAQRIVGSAVASALAAQLGAAILRVHDVIETRDAMRVMQMLVQGQQ
jgi:dihydropteroate synthase|tara:strand:- start:5514 stop:6356 length:843 start_codon:yes stop_codon:yes gene_type:complete